MSGNQLLTDTVNINYIYTALNTVLVQQPNLLRNGISNDTPIIRRCCHQNWADLRDDGLRYVIAYDLTLSDFVLGTLKSLGNANIVSHDMLQLNYNYPLIKLSSEGKRIPVTIHDVLRDPLSRTYLSNQSGASGNTAYDYALQIQLATKAIASQFPNDIRLVNYNKLVNFVYEYDWVSPGGQPTRKRSIIGIMKYKNAQGQDRIIMNGTGIQEYLVVS